MNERATEQWLAALGNGDPEMGLARLAMGAGVLLGSGGVYVGLELLHMAPAITLAVPFVAYLGMLAVRIVTGEMR